MARRPITITINNQTGSSLSLGNVDREHGTDPDCSQNIDNQASGTITAEEHLNYGPVGTVQYKVDSSGGIYTIAYNHPVTSNPTSVTVTAPAGFGFKCVSSDLQDKHASCTYEFTDNPEDASTCSQ